MLDAGYLCGCLAPNQFPLTCIQHHVLGDQGCHVVCSCYLLVVCGAKVLPQLGSNTCNRCWVACVQEPLLVMCTMVRFLTGGCQWVSQGAKLL